MPDPVARYVDRAGRARRVLQDCERKTPIGADDRLGVALITWLAIRQEIDVALLFTTDEERGLLSAWQLPPEWFADFSLVVEVHYGNRPSAELVSRVEGVPLCSPRRTSWLLDLSATIGLPRIEADGPRTDAYAMRCRDLVPEAVNMTCGYHESFKEASGEEYVDLEEAADTLRFLLAIARAVRR
jgi:hypothetical protein